MGIWHSRQTSSLRGNRFCRCPERSHCCDLYVFRQPTLSWTLPTIHESRTFVSDPDLYVSWRNIPIALIERRPAPIGGSRFILHHGERPFRIEIISCGSRLKSWLQPDWN